MSMAIKNKIVKTNNNFYVQDGTGPWNGVLAFQTANVVARGDEITITATVSEYASMTELTSPTSVVIPITGDHFEG